MEAVCGPSPACSVAGWLMRGGAPRDARSEDDRVASAIPARASALKAEADQRADGPEPVAPGDLLAVGVRAAEIADRDFVQAHLSVTQDLGRQLGFDREVVRDQL